MGDHLSNNRRYGRGPFRPRTDGPDRRRYPHLRRPRHQYHSTINKWHTCPNTDRINASNPCSEYMFLDDSACNLASLNLTKFLSDDGEFDVEGYRRAVDIFFTAQEILVDFSSYPTEGIAQNSHDYRPLGLGYANLGSLLMQLGIGYDSDKGRAMAGAPNEYKSVPAKNETTTRPLLGSKRSTRGMAAGHHRGSGSSGSRGEH